MTIPKKDVKEKVEPLKNSALTSLISYVDIKPDRTFHNSSITCQVDHEGLDKPILRTVTMFVKFPPIVTISKHFVTAHEGDDVSVL